MAKQTKTTTKKTVVKKTAVKPAPVMEQTCACGKDCPCGCHKHGFAHALKHIVIWAIIFALGMFCGKMMNCDAAHKKMQQRFHPVFTNGCLDMQSIDNKKMQEALQKADVNADECISVEEYRAVKKEMRPMNKKGPRAQKSK
ncbi:MAG: hypothetical protein IKN73_00220 [Alphaproteobacteria bacterium]|nr:hypothetical protein [Alphaproteobacteria bacterium]